MWSCTLRECDSGTDRCEKVKIEDIERCKQITQIIHVEIRHNNVIFSREAPFIHVEMCSPQNTFFFYKLVEENARERIHHL